MLFVSEAIVLDALPPMVGHATNGNDMYAEGEERDPLDEEDDVENEEDGENTFIYVNVHTGRCCNLRHVVGDPVVAVATPNRILAQPSSEDASKKKKATPFSSLVASQAKQKSPVLPKLVLTYEELPGYIRNAFDPQPTSTATDGTPHFRGVSSQPGAGTGFQAQYWLGKPIGQVRLGTLSDRKVAALLVHVAGIDPALTSGPQQARLWLDRVIQSEDEWKTWYAKFVLNVVTDSPSA